MSQPERRVLESDQVSSYPDGESGSWRPAFAAAASRRGGPSVPATEWEERAAGDGELDGANWKGPSELVSESGASEERGTGPGVPHDVNQSLARLEMSSLEVKHYLDSIDQRISRMEPRIEEMRSTEPASNAAAVPRQGMDPEGAGAGRATTERRRRAQGIPPVERRRAPLAASDARDGVEPWSYGATWRPKVEAWWEARQKAWEGRATPERRWLPAIAVGVAGVLVLAIWAGGSRGRKGTVDHRAPAADAGSLLAGAVPSGLSKSSGGVPWAPGSGYGSTPASAAGGSRRVEQGVIAPGYASLTSGTVAAGRGPDGVEGSGAGASGVAAGSLPESAVATTDSGNAASDSGTGTSLEPSAGKGLVRGGPAARRLEVSSGVMAGNLISSRPPAYPRGIAGLFHSEGKVVMQAIISKSGRVENLRVISGHYVLRGAAKDAVRSWRYRPYYVNGGAVEVATIVSVEFHR